MTDSEFEAFLANANEELRAKQALLVERYSLGETQPLVVRAGNRETAIL